MATIDRVVKRARKCCMDTQGRRIILVSLIVGLSLSFILTPQQGSSSMAGAEIFADGEEHESDLYPMIQPWPKGWLRINRTRVVVGGNSNSGDFAHQVHIAYSSMINGACLFTAQPFHCAVMRFQQDPLVDAGFFEDKDKAHNVPLCEDCPDGKTLVYDHCKNLPHVVDVGQLPDYPRRECGADGAPGCLDNTDHLRNPNQRVYLQRGTRDKCYRKGSVANVQALYAQLMDNPTEQIKFNNTLRLKHEIPAYGNADDPNYDGPTECFKHTLFHGMAMRPPTADKLRTIREQIKDGGGGEDWDDSRRYPNTWRFAQTTFDGFDPVVGTNRWGWIYVPPSCSNMSSSSSACALMVWFRPCGGGAWSKDINWETLDYLAETNKVVILTPVVGKNHCYREYPGCHEVSRGCWDGYGQLGKDYALQSGKHMRFVGSILKGFLEAYGE